MAIHCILTQLSTHKYTAISRCEGFRYSTNLGWKFSCNTLPNMTQSNKKMTQIRRLNKRVSTSASWTLGYTVHHTHTLPPFVILSITIYSLIIGYISSTFLLEISSGKRAYTTLASWVSASDSTRILPMRIERQQSRKPWT